MARPLNIASYLLSLPRASWKIRLLTAVFIAFSIWSVAQEWQSVNPDFPVSSMVVLFSISTSVFFLPWLLVIALLGRMPKLFARMPAMWNRTLPQIHVDLARERAEQRERSRLL